MCYLRAFPETSSSEAYVLEGDGTLSQQARHGLRLRPRRQPGEPYVLARAGTEWWIQCLLPLRVQEARGRFRGVLHRVVLLGRLPRRHHVGSGRLIRRAVPGIDHGSWDDLGALRGGLALAAGRSRVLQQGVPVCGG